MSHEHTNTRNILGVRLKPDTTSETVRVKPDTTTVLISLSETKTQPPLNLARVARRRPRQERGRHPVRGDVRVEVRVIGDVVPLDQQIEVARAAAHDLPGEAQVEREVLIEVEQRRVDCRQVPRAA